jgi:hypothetical protein
MPKVDALLERKITSLEEYIQMTAPPTATSAVSGGTPEPAPKTAVPEKGGAT